VSLIGPTNIPPLEAMTAGCPAIVSDIYAMPDQVGDAGLMVDPLNPADIAHKISLIWNDEALRQSMIEKGFRQIQQWGSVQFNSRFKDIVDNILSPGSLLHNRLLKNRV
jgi:glycosyltransferase involved in cell wall biosynthesis